MKEKLRTSVVIIENGTELEQFRDLLELNNENCLMAYSEDFTETEEASKGYVIYEAGINTYCLYKNIQEDDKPITLKELLDEA